MWTTVSIRIIAKLNPTSRTLSPNHNLVKAREVPQLVGEVQWDDGQKFTDSRCFTTPVIGSEESCKSPDLDTLVRCILHTLYLRGNLGTPDYPGVPPNSMRREPAYRFKYFVPLRRGPVREFREQTESQAFLETAHPNRADYAFNAPLKNGVNKSIGTGRKVVVLCSLAISRMV